MGRAEAKARRTTAASKKVAARGTRSSMAKSTSRGIAKRKARTARAVRAKKPTAARIVVFTCSWYPAIAADNAGVIGKQYPADTRIVTLECGGRLTPALILDAFGAGAAGVLVATCKPELCHYVNGSSKCEGVVAETRELVELLGIGAERIELETFDSEDGERFADRVTQFCKKVAKFGPVPLER
jgi:F420-non-reducing hydrogenase iron-sulfur subunit